MRKILILFVFLAVLLMGCSYNEPELSDNDHMVTFTDDLERTVSISQPQRVAALLGSFADVWTLAGGEVAAAPDDAWEDFELPMSDEAVNLGNTKNLSLEMLFSVNPDFVIASSNTRIDLEWLDTLEKSGITVAYFDVSDFDDYLRMLKICTDITGRSDLYQKNGIDIGSEIDNVIKESEKRIAEKGMSTVLSLRASSSSIRAKNSKGNVLGEMLLSLGCINIADSESSLLENLSIEYIAKADPDYIFFVQSGDDTEGTQENVEKFIDSNPLWKELSAVKNGKVFTMDKRLYNLKPNSRWSEAYEELERILEGYYT